MIGEDVSEGVSLGSWLHDPCFTCQKRNIKGDASSLVQGADHMEICFTPNQEGTDEEWVCIWGFGEYPRLRLDIRKQIYSPNELSQANGLTIDDIAKRRGRNLSTDEIDEKSAALQYMEILIK
jgi:hypothetical protein